MTRFDEDCYFDEVTELNEPPLCPVCEHGYGMFLGTLGMVNWFRCAACGMDFRVGLVNTVDPKQAGS